MLDDETGHGCAMAGWLVGYLDPWRCICPEFPPLNNTTVQCGPFCIQIWGALQMITNAALIHDNQHYADKEDDGNYW